VFNVTKEAVVARQVKQFDQLPPTPGGAARGLPTHGGAASRLWAEALHPARLISCHQTDAACEEIV